MTDLPSYTIGRLSNGHYKGIKYKVERIITMYKNKHEVDRETGAYALYPRPKGATLTL